MRHYRIGCIALLVPLLSSCTQVHNSPPAAKVTNGLIAFTLRDSSGHLQIFTQQPDGTHRRQLTFEGDNGRPDWSPDGSKIVFGFMRDGHSWVSVMNADGSDQHRLVE